MKELEKAIGYEFKNKDLLLMAFTHSSYANEFNVENYERLEFLGDSVLGMVTSEYIFSKFPKFPEGKLTKLRSYLVCEKTLKSFSRKINAGRFLLLSKGEERNGGRKRDSILADVFESLVAAVFIDGGIESVKKLVLNFISEQLNHLDECTFDYKSEIQERNQALNNGVISYVLVNEVGPDHNKKFTVELKINGKSIGTGTASSKKESEQLAAKNALRSLENKDFCL
ncbi:MAG: ribonuclease III [Oscillospiraceae bacterium]|jgi:ribonuclease-3|nr:ribonuclease III [Oscillospiraceae bacterium]